MTPKLETMEMGILNAQRREDLALSRLQGSGRKVAKSPIERNRGTNRVCKNLRRLFPDSGGQSREARDNAGGCSVKREGAEASGGSFLPRNQCARPRSGTG